MEWLLVSKRICENQIDYDEIELLGVMEDENDDFEDEDELVDTCILTTEY